MEMEPPPAQVASLRDLHNRRCYLNGITDSAKVDKLWREYCEKRAKESAPQLYRPGNAHGDAV